ncbi:NAD(P)/FAD-dependent oxidoreductase [Halobacillus massiliensis]|uniref:NAD(P)/FAD-dependent oxidoreductase n=1 Tax=Halobacillus massiliensis TaxID=1926286 RepID=UPI0009E48EF4|nr:FAD-dependent oxidoreductase [Halobacillus massiliensis]
MYDVAIIGAGFAGLTAAVQLQKAGRKIILFEQQSRAGGRAATKKIKGGKADYGAQFFTVRTETFQRSVDEWLNKGWIKRWFGEDYPRYTSVNGMERLAEHLADNCEVKYQTKVMKLVKEGGGFQIQTADGKAFKSARVLLTMPAPLMVNLLRNSGIEAESFSNLVFKPTYVGIFHLDSSGTIPDSGHLDKDLPEGVERIVDHFKKGISQTCLISVYMTADWSENHNSREAGEILTEIKSKIKNYLPLDSLHEEVLEYWPYAQASKTFNASFMKLEENLYAAGDAFLRPDDSAGRTRLESAFLSGYDAGNAIETALAHEREE